MTVVRRFLTLCGLGLWLGGLTFYAIVVIRNAHQVVHSTFKVGLITQRVTGELNGIGAGVLAVMLWNAAASWRPSGAWIRRGLAISLAAAVAAHGAVCFLHSRLDGMLAAQSPETGAGAGFHRPHEIYLIATSVEWIAGLVYLLASLRAWRREDAVTADRT